MFPDEGHGPCSDCQRDYEKFDPWDIVAIPIWWAIALGYWLRDRAEGFIRHLRRPK